MKSPTELIELTANERFRELFSLIAAGDGLIESGDRPEWAILAAKNFFRCIMDLPKTKTAKSHDYQMGFTIGLIKGLGISEFKSEPALSALIKDDQIAKMGQELVLNMPTTDAANLSEGFADGLRRSQNFSPANPYLIYFLIAMFWREIAAFKNTSEFHSWIAKHCGANHAGHLERIATICRRIKLRFPDKGGRPKKKPPSPSIS